MLLGQSEDAESSFDQTFRPDIHNRPQLYLELRMKVLLSQSVNANSNFKPGQIPQCLKCSQPYLELHVKVLLGQSSKSIRASKQKAQTRHSDQRFRPTPNLTLSSM